MNKSIGGLRIHQILLAIIFIFFTACNNNDGANSGRDFGNATADLLPVVKKTSFSGKNFSFKGDWTISGTSDIKETVAYKSLLEGLQSASDGNIKLTENADAIIQLVLKPGMVAVENNLDTNKTNIEQQAYSLHLEGKSITITANAAQGLYYGVQTFLQLLETNHDHLLPEGEITDWPDLSLRMIYWDDAHHLEKFNALKRIIRQASQYKINAFAIKLEGHFQFKSAPAIVEPYALSADQYQELTDYAKSYFVELVPYLDAPAHVSFILKHPEYAKLRLYPNNNYQFSDVDTNAIALVKSMFNDLLQANKGGKYIVLSTDEAYYTGKAPSEKKAVAEAGSNGKLLARFIKIIADELNKQGRTIIFWGEYPLVADDITALPPYLVNGVYNEMASAFRKRGIRQLVYTYTQGEEAVFPNYYPIRNNNSAGDSNRTERVANMLKDIRTAAVEKKSLLMGVFIAGWSDAGLHPETFWLGYMTGAAMAWNIGDAKADDLTKRFFKSFYHRDPSAMDSIYRLLSAQAEFFDMSWDWKESDLRKPILGNSEGIFPKPEKLKDQFMPMLPVPSANNFSTKADWDLKRIALIEKYIGENDALMQLITANRSKEKQQYNWEVLTSVPVLCRQNLDMLVALRKANDYLKLAAKNANANDPASAVACIDTALSIATGIQKQRDSVFAFVSEIWYKEWLPLVSEANGRRFLHVVDDIKDHRPGRTIDLSYLIYRQLHFPLGEWANRVLKNRNSYALAHRLPALNAER